MSKKLQITENQIRDLRQVRNYFGENDKTAFEHKAYSVINNIINILCDSDCVEIVKGEN